MLRDLKMNNPEPIGQAADGYQVYGFELDADATNIFSIICGWEDEPPMQKYCTTLYDGSIAVEWNDPFYEKTDGPFYGDRSLFECLVAPSIEISDELAKKWLDVIKKNAFITENSIILDDITGKYYEDCNEGLPQYLWWSDHNGYYCGPGSDASRFTDCFDNPKRQFYPLLEVSGVDNIKKLREVLEARIPRSICPARKLFYTNYNNQASFGEFSISHDLDLPDALDWLNSLNGESLDALRPAELETIEQIDIWIKWKEDLVLTAATLTLEQSDVTENSIVVWHYSEAPNKFQELSTNGGDEDWIAFVPASYNGVCPNWLEEENCGFGRNSIDSHPIANGTIYIGSHA